MALRGPSSKRDLKKPGGGRRKAVSLAQKSTIETREIFPGESLPLVVEPTMPGVDLLSWTEHHRDFVEEKILKHGGVLFRNFEVTSIPEFERFITVVSGGAMEYKYRSSPRTTVGGNIYTSTDYPADQSIFPHNEHSYSPSFPLRLFFFCDTPAATGGETPLGDCRKILARIDPEIRREFQEKGIMYVRNFGDGFGLPWSTVFQTEDRAEVEAYCAAQGLAVEWKEGNRLRTRRVGPAIFQHPRTGEELWFNHACFYHWTTLEPTVRKQLVKVFEEDEMPNNTFYGDGTPISRDVAEHLRQAYLEELVVFPWQKGDLLALDNMLAIHARNPYGGERKVVVGMAELQSAADLVH